MAIDRGTGGGNKYHPASPAKAKKTAAEFLRNGYVNGHAIPANRKTNAQKQEFRSQRGEITGNRRRGANVVTGTTRGSKAIKQTKK